MYSAPPANASTASGTCPAGCNFSSFSGCSPAPAFQAGTRPFVCGRFGLAFTFTAVFGGFGRSFAGSFGSTRGLGRARREGSGGGAGGAGGCSGACARWQAWMSLRAKGCFEPKSTIARTRPSRRGGTTHMSYKRLELSCARAVAACTKVSSKHSRRTRPAPGTGASLAIFPHSGQTFFSLAACFAIPGVAMLFKAASRPTCPSPFRYAVTISWLCCTSSPSSGHGHRRTLATRSVFTTAASTSY
mmetsp:Transcript_92847/g.128883  ORF Transcript_92847/g.128883 Transcript_92847/m.128883 type:complete len:245 (+) Transcript_92847:196-930(+)